MARDAAVTAALLAATATCCGGQEESDRSGQDRGGQQQSDPSGAGAGGYNGRSAGGQTSEAGAGGEGGDAAGAGPPELWICEWTHICATQLAVGIGTADHLLCEVEIPLDWGPFNPNEMRVGTDCDLLTPSPDDPAEGWTYDSDRRVVVIRGADCDRLLAGDAERIDVGIACTEGGIAAARPTGRGFSIDGRRACMLCAG
jgi:hypothetical protein